MSRLLIIANPQAGRRQGETTAVALRDALDRDEHDVRLRFTDRPGHAGEIAASEADRFDAVFSVGGDGTLREIIVGLQDLTRIPVGIIPLGCANVLARELGIPRGHPLRTARSLLAGSRIEADVGMANERPFLANVGAGFDARVVEALHATRNRRSRGLGMAAYVPVGAKTLLGFGTPRLAVRTEDGERHGPFHSVTVCNTANYGGVMKLTPGARIDDGVLDCHVRRGRGRRTVIRNVLCAVFGLSDSSRTQILRGRRFTISSDDVSEPFQVDGDPGGVLPVEIRLSERRQLLMTPAPTHDEERP